MKTASRTRIIICLILCHLIISALFTVPQLARSVREFTVNAGAGDRAVKERIYGDFYRTMIVYLDRIPVSENAVIVKPPGELAHYFWILNYYFLPRRIYELPESLSGDEEIIRPRRIRHAIFTRPDGFFFDRYPPPKQDRPQ